jgi:predicted nucleic acid-binding protein
MVVTRSWLIDKSALVRLVSSPDADDWIGRIERGLVRITTATLLETGFSARSAEEMTMLLDCPPISQMPVEYFSPAAELRAVEVLRQLVHGGRHRAPSVPDLLIAAVAEQAKLTVLHLDKDFELIAGATGQPMERLRLE